MNPKKELLWGLWVPTTWPQALKPKTFNPESQIPNPKHELALGLWEIWGGPSIPTASRGGCAQLALQAGIKGPVAQIVYTLALK